MEGTATPSFGHEERDYDLVVVGGGMAGIAAAVTAAREGARVALVQERPVLGGSASTEVRVNLEGANGGRHNRFFVESGLAEDLLLTNLWHNPTGSADHWCALLLDLVLEQDRLDLYLDTVADGIRLTEARRLDAVTAYTLASERRWTFRADYFVDATGDGTIACLAGAEFMYGEEAREAFGEPLAALEPTELTLGGTMQFMCKDVGRPVIFEPPLFARKVTEEELRVNRGVNVWQQDPVLGGFWWIEYGGDLDTIGDNAEIKQMLLAEVYGVWDFVKNDPKWRDRNRNLDIEWVAAIVGKRESRRVVGDHVLTENDIMEQRRFDDAVAFGGWSIDRHAPRGFLDIENPPCVQVHPPSVYQIPLRALYARDVPNLFLAGRDISCSHVACCSSRVMLTCTHCGEAVGAAAALCARKGLDPRSLSSDEDLMAALRARLERIGHHIPYKPLETDRIPADARVTASSESILRDDHVDKAIPFGGPRMLSLPLTRPQLDAIELWIEAPRVFELSWRVWDREPDGAWVPAGVLASGTARCEARPDGGWVRVPVELSSLRPGYVHFGFSADDPDVLLGVNDDRQLGPLSWRSSVGDLDARPTDRRADEGWALPQNFEEFGDSAACIFAYWRRDGHGWGGPPGPSIAFRVVPEQVSASAKAVLDPFERPTVDGIHAWVSNRCDGARHDGKFVLQEPEWLAVELAQPMHAEAIDVYFNSDVDRHLANIWFSHPPGMRAMPTLVSDYIVEVLLPDGTWRELARVEDNYLRRRSFPLRQRIAGWRVTCTATHGTPFVSIVDLRIRQA
jgi:hypothetical protein